MTQGKTFFRELSVWETFLHLEEANTHTRLSNVGSQHEQSTPERNGQARVRALAARDSIQQMEDLILERSDYRPHSSSTSHRLIIGNRPRNFGTRLA